MEIQKNNRKKIVVGIIISFCLLLAVYLGISMYFKSHFYFGSKINGIDIAGKTVEEADKEISSLVENYTLQLKGRGDVNAEIKGTDIGLKYNPNNKVQELKDEQNPFGWISSIFSKKDLEISNVVSYNDKLLKESLNKLPFFNTSKITEPKNPQFKYKDNEYVIEDEVYGNKINKEALYKQVEKAIYDGKTTLDLDSSNCYENPKFTSKSDKAKETKEILDKYVGTKITYTIGDKEEVLDGSIINNWLSVDDNLDVKFDEKKVRNYVVSLARSYNTFGNTRDFATSIGKTVKVSGGNYGWIIDTPGETKDLIEKIKEGKSITKEPKYSQTAVTHDENDVGNTYVEINLTRQHVWFYKDGVLLTEGDVVTGNESNKWGTPAGTYRLTYKERNATLKGENYSSKVNFWMPFNGNIGLHDAGWRNKFGGDIYKTSGSHGCVNAPYDMAKVIFDNITQGTPIVCYTE